MIGNVPIYLALCNTGSYTNIQGTVEDRMTDDVVVTVRVPKALAQRVQQMAVSRDETVSQVIRRGLRGYVSRASKINENEDAA